MNAEWFIELNAIIPKDVCCVWVRCPDKRFFAGHDLIIF